MWLDHRGQKGQGEYKSGSVTWLVLRQKIAPWTSFT